MTIAEPHPFGRGSESADRRWFESGAAADRSTTGVTLVELLVVLAIVALMLGIAYPNLTAGLDGIRLRTSLDRAGSFWASARQFADRNQKVVQVTVNPKANAIEALAAESDWRGRYDFSGGVRIAAPAAPRSYLLYPGTPAPRFELLLEAADGSRAGLRTNIFTGVPEEWDGK